MKPWRNVVFLCAAFWVAAPAADKKGAKEAQTNAAPARVSIEPRAKPGTADPAESRGPSNIRVDSTLVLINVTVTDPMNRFVTGLDKDFFRLWEDNNEQTIAQFSSEDAPLSVGLVFDSSGSMGSKLHKSRQAAAQFFKTANPEDEFFLIQFNDRAELMVPFTHNTEEIQNRLTFTQAKGRTALLDAVHLAINHMKKGKNPRKAILILSDGGDNSSRYTESEIRNIVREADVQIYAMGILSQQVDVGGRRKNCPDQDCLLKSPNKPADGIFPIENINELPDVAAKIGVELRNQYVLGYAPTNLTRDGKYRRVKVKVNQPRGFPTLRAFWRLGYYAPTQ